MADIYNLANFVYSHTCVSELFLFLVSLPLPLPFFLLAGGVPLNSLRPIVMLCSMVCELPETSQSGRMFAARACVFCIWDPTAPMWFLRIIFVE